MEEPLSAITQTGLLIVLVVAAIGLAILVVWTVTHRRTEEDNREEMLLRLGYALTSPPPELRAQLARLHRGRGAQAPEFRSVYRRPIADGDIYLCDLVNADQIETSKQAGDTLAVVSSTLNLPRFTLLPRPSVLQEQAHAGGMLARLADMAFDAMVAQTGLTELSYPDDPEFSENFIVLAEDESAARAFLTNRLREQLLQGERRYVIDAVGDTFTLTRSLTEQQAILSEEGIDVARGDAERILTWLGKRGTSYT